MILITRISLVSTAQVQWSVCDK